MVPSNSFYGSWMFSTTATVLAASAAAYCYFKIYQKPESSGLCKDTSNNSGSIEVCSSPSLSSMNRISDSSKSEEDLESNRSLGKKHKEEIANDLEDLRELADNFEYNRMDYNIVHRKQKVKVTKASTTIKSTQMLKSQTIPGIQKVYVKSYGCSHNSSDSEYMMGLLDSYGYSFAQSIEAADICLINSCTVKNPSQDTVLALLEKAKGLGKPVVVSGCIPQADRNLIGLEYASVIGITQIDRIVEVVEQALSGNVVRLLAKKSLPSLDIPKIRRNPLVEIIPLSTGCLGSCTYCKTKHARGKLGSYKLEAILKRVEKVINEGVKQIWLTSEDTGAYGLDIGLDISKLLDAVVSILPDGVMLRLGMSNPPYMMKHISDIGRILNHPRVFEFIHIPVQSGSNETLKHMFREYSREDFEYTVNMLRNAVPDLTVATDIICGFPTETELDHKETLELIEKYKFPILNISQFYPRPGTTAASMKRVPTQTVKRRTREVTALFESYSCFDFLMNTVQKVWFSECSDRSNHIVGHTKHYVKVLAEWDLSLMGSCVWMKIVAVQKWHVIGERVDSSS